MKKGFFIISVIAGLALAGCNPDDPQKPENNDSQKEKPVVPEVPGGNETEDPLAYLKDYKPLRTYVDRNAHPIFHLGAAIEAQDFAAREKAYKTVVENFDEMTAGNAMKYSSCVSDNGSMDFSVVRQFVKGAKDTGLTIYGHTLAWHSQQRPAYLNKLIAGKYAGDGPETTEIVSNGDCEGTDLTSLFATEKNNGGGPKAATITDKAGYNGSRGVVVRSSSNPANTWDNQFFVKVGRTLSAGTNYRFSMMFKADKPATISTQAHATPGDYNHWEMIGNLQATTEWQKYEFEGTISADQAGQGKGFTTIAFNLSELSDANVYYFDDISFQLLEGGTKVPLTAKEKKDTLTWALTRWIAGMMEATDGYVKTWDVVNEAISGGGNDGQGYYALQSNDGNSANFFWQDYLGAEDYVRIAVKAARDNFKGAPEDLKLFINDYNLESDWDNNMKVKSMVHWIQRWESDGVTKIDGIGTQMHVSYYMNEGTQKSKEKAISNSFQILADSGKLIKISELDMGIVGMDGKEISTSSVTLEQHKKMAEFYNFIVSEYMRIIPPAQQYGITQWCMTDSPSNSGWRANMPVGLWDLNFNRKPEYGGFADGLAK